MKVCTECGAIENVRKLSKEELEDLGAMPNEQIEVCGSCDMDAFKSYDEDYGKER